jgi:hypothetical protein
LIGSFVPVSDQVRRSENARYSIISSAPACSACGTVRPSALTAPCAPRRQLALAGASEETVYQLIECLCPLKIHGVATLLAHIENKVITVDAIREARSPFSPDAVVREHADLLKRYHVEAVVGDRYGGEWPREKYREHGIGYRVAPKNRSELYLAMLPQLNSKCVALLDNKRLVSQLCGLERRASRGGRDVVDHAPGGHDDVANAVAGAVVIALEAAGQELPAVSPIIIDKNGQEITAPSTNQAGRPPSHWLKLGQQEAWMPFVGHGRFGI